MNLKELPAQLKANLAKLNLNRQQTIVLAVLGVLNLLVVCAMGFTVISTTLRGPAAPPPATLPATSPTTDATAAGTATPPPEQATPIPTWTPKGTATLPPTEPNLDQEAQWFLEEQIAERSSIPQGMISVGDNTTGELTEPAQVHDWTIEGQAGQRLTIMCETPNDANTDPRLGLLGPGGNLVAADDDSGIEWNARLGNIGLPEDGTYTLKVSMAGIDTGTYTLSITPGRAGDEEPLKREQNEVMSLSSSQQGSLDYGDRRTGTLEDMLAAHDWTFEGQAGDRVTIRCAAAGEEDEEAETDPRITLVGPAGGLLTEDDDSGANGAAVIAYYLLPSTGTYTIKIDVWDPGAYVLYLKHGEKTDLFEEPAAKEATALPAAPQGDVELGEMISRRLYTIEGAHDWTLAGQEGQTLTIRCVSDPESNTDPRITLLGPTGDIIAQDDDSGGGFAALLEGIELPQTGEYIIRIDVWEPGRYELTVE